MRLFPGRWFRWSATSSQTCCPLGKTTEARPEGVRRAPRGRSGPVARRRARRGGDRQRRHGHTRRWAFREQTICQRPASFYRHRHGRGYVEAAAELRAASVRRRGFRLGIRLGRRGRGSGRGGRRGDARRVGSAAHTTGAGEGQGGSQPHQGGARCLGAAAGEDPS